ncbi:MAG: glycosyltransferase [Flavobacteriales bacterium]|nr:glycosyltransferase [Flavobacteriales bacterium]
MKQVIYLGSNGFPYGMAQIQRQLYISKALSQAGYHVTVCSRKGVYRKHKNEYVSIPMSGSHQGIDFLFSSGVPFYQSNFLVRNLLKVVGFFGELGFIVGRKLSGNLDYLFVNTISLIDLKYYSVLSKLLRVDLVYDYVEQVGELSVSTGSSKNFDSVFTKYCDRIIYISDQLLRNIVPSIPESKTLKIPPLTDFELFRKAEDDTNNSSAYFLYCGSAGYQKVITFIIDAFDQIDDTQFELRLIVNGSATDMNLIRQHILGSRKQQRINVLSGLPLDQLIYQYKGASAMLIPLRDTVQDKARFPHKISEYLATGNPLITTHIGEIDNYFVDNENALIADDFTVESYCEKMRLVIEHRQLAQRIGVAGYGLGMRHFDFRCHSEPLQEFLSK